MSRARRSFLDLMYSWIPFGIHERKPRHFLTMLKIAWRNRDNLGHAWRVLTQGVCDGCALGTSGLSDWTVDGTHLCLVRLELLRLNTIGAVDPGVWDDAAALSARTSAELRNLGRLAYPMRRRRGEKGFTRVSFESAWQEIGARWRALDPRRTAMFVTSRGVTNETYYAAQKVMRFLGTNNVDNSARICHSPSTAGLKTTIGVAATTCSYRDWWETDLIVFLGSNPANDQPVAMKYLFEARRRGARVLMVNAYREPGMERYWVPSNATSAVFGTKMTDRFFLVKVGGDMAFLNAVQKVLLERGQVKTDFVESATTGFAALRACLDAQPLAELCGIAGVAEAEVRAFADEIAGADRAVLVWSMGITQHVQGGETVRAIANLGLLREYVGRPGTGLMPIRGHSGVQGGAEMGAYATAFPGGLPIDRDNARHFESLWGFPISSEEGLTAVDAIDRAHAGDLDAYYLIGGNFLETLPEPERIGAALSRIGLRIHTDIMLSSQMLVEPQDTVFILPSQTRYEQTGGGTETSTERRVIFSPRIEGHDIGEARSEWEMLLDFAAAVRPGAKERLGLSDGPAIRRDIAQAVPFYAGIEKLAKKGDQFQWGGSYLCQNRLFPTADGKAHFQPVTPDALGAGRPVEGFRLATRRGKQFNSMVQESFDPITGAERDHILMAAADARRLGLKDGSPIRLVSSTGEFQGRVFLAPVAPGTLQGHWPEVNGLVPSGVVDRDGGVPDYNATVRVIPLA